MSNSIDATLQERQSTHGDFREVSDIIQQLKEVCRNSPNWEKLTSHQKEAVDMVCHKLGRILSGEANEPDHWRDLSGYSALIMHILNGSFDSLIYGDKGE